MSKKTIVFITIIVALILLNLLDSNKVDVKDLALYSTYVKIIDHDTEEPINVGVTLPKTVLQPNNVGIIKAEIKDGLIKIAYIDFKNKNHSIKINHENYDSLDIPTKYIEQVSGSSAEVLSKPFIIKLKQKK